MAQYKVNIGPSQAKTDLGDYFVNIGPYQGGGVPVITSQSGDISQHVGDTASMWVVAIGNPSPTYQWYFGAILIPGATNSTYSFTVGIASGGSYTCVVSNIHGDVTSAPIILSVYPYVVSQSGNSSHIAGALVSLFVTVAGYPALSYQWYKNNFLVPGATSSVYTPYVGIGSVETYKCVVSNAIGSTESNLIYVTIVLNPHRYNAFILPLDADRS